MKRLFLFLFVVIFSFASFSALAQTLRPNRGGTVGEAPTQSQRAYQRQSGKIAPSKHRFVFYAGLYLPTGEYSEDGMPFDLEFENGFGGGIEYDYYFADSIGIGFFLDHIKSNTKTEYYYGASFKIKKVEVTNIGVVLPLRTELGQGFWFTGDLRAGIAFGSAKMEAKMGSDIYSDDYDATDFTFSAQAGIKYLFEKWELGIYTKYTNSSFEVEDGGEADFSGFSVLIGAGYNF